MNRRFTSTLTRLTALALALGLGAPAMAGVCHQVSFSFTNHTGGPIKVLKVKYKDVQANSTNVEYVATVTCADLDTCQTSGDDLGSLVEARLGHDLTSIRFFFQQQNALGAWLPAAYSKAFVPSDKECRDDRKYGPFIIQ